MAATDAASPAAVPGVPRWRPEHLPRRAIGKAGPALAAELLARRVRGAAARALAGQWRGALAAELLAGGIDGPAIRAGHVHLLAGTCALTVATR